MRKVITVNLNNNAYQVEDAGFDALKAYLATAEARLAANPDRQEILVDLEQAIADKCDSFLGAHKNVVTVAEIDQILKEMGPVNGADGSSAEAGAEGLKSGATDAPGAATGGTQSAYARAPRRLYRLPDEGMLGGVCAGLAAYFSVDVVWVRLLFVLLAFFTGIWFFAWLVMLIVMPRARTPEEVAAAHGEPFNAHDVIERAKKKYQDFSSAASAAGRRHWEQHEPRMKNFGEDFRQAGENLKDGMQNLGRGAADMSLRMRNQARRQQARYRAQFGPGLGRRSVGYGAQVAAGLTLPVLSIISAALFVAFIIALLTLLASGTIHGWSPLPFMPHWVAILALVLCYCIVASPLRAARRASHRYANGGSEVGWASAWDGMLWIGLVALLFWGAYQFAPGLREIIDGLPVLFHGSRTFRV